MKQKKLEKKQPIQCRVQFRGVPDPLEKPDVGRYRVTTNPADALMDGVSRKKFDALAQEVFHIDGEDCFVESKFYRAGNWVALFVRTGVNRVYKIRFENQLCDLLEKKSKKRKKKNEKKKSKKK